MRQTTQVSDSKKTGNQRYSNPSDQRKVILDFYSKKRGRQYFGVLFHRSKLQNTLFSNSYDGQALTIAMGIQREGMNHRQLSMSNIFFLFVKICTQQVGQNLLCKERRLAICYRLLMIRSSHRNLNNKTLFFNIYVDSIQNSCTR